MDKFVPFPERVRYAMLQHAINAGVTAPQLSKRLGWPLHKVRKMVMAKNAQVRIGDVAEWFFGVDGSMVKFDLLPA